MKKGSAWRAPGTGNLSLQWRSIWLQAGVPSLRSPPHATEPPETKALLSRAVLPERMRVFPSLQASPIMRALSSALLCPALLQDCTRCSLLPASCGALSQWSSSSMAGLAGGQQGEEGEEGGGRRGCARAPHRGLRQVPEGT